MSRTFRCKGYEDTQRTSWHKEFNSIAGYYTVRDWRYEGDAYWWEGRQPTEHERWKRFHDVHGESSTRNSRSPGREFRKARMKENRSITRQELHRFVYQAGYEPMVEAEPRSCWWDWD